MIQNCYTIKHVVGEDEEVYVKISHAVAETSEEALALLGVSEAKVLSINIVEVTIKG